jgi:hypothetical protein
MVGTPVSKRVKLVNIIVLRRGHGEAARLELPAEILMSKRVKLVNMLSSDEALNG